MFQGYSCKLGLSPKICSDSHCHTQIILPGSWTIDAGDKRARSIDLPEKVGKMSTTSRRKDKQKKRSKNDEKQIMKKKKGKMKREEAEKKKKDRSK